MIFLSFREAQIAQFMKPTRALMQFPVLSVHFKLFYRLISMTTVSW